MLQYQLDGIDDANVTSAATDIAGQFITYPFAVRPWQTQHDVPRSAQHAGRAVTALQRVLGMKGLAQIRHHRIIGIALDGGDPGTIAGSRQGDARTLRRAVDQYRAGTAHPMLTRQMRARQPKVLAQCIRQAGARFTAQLH